MIGCTTNNRYIAGCLQKQTSSQASTIGDIILAQVESTSDRKKDARGNPAYNHPIRSRTKCNYVEISPGLNITFQTNKGHFISAPTRKFWVAPVLLKIKKKLWGMHDNSKLYHKIKCKVGCLTQLQGILIRTLCPKSCLYDPCLLKSLSPLSFFFPKVLKNKGNLPPLRDILSTKYYTDDITWFEVMLKAVPKPLHIFRKKSLPCY